MKRPQVAPVIRQLTQQNDAVLGVATNQTARSVATGSCSTAMTWDDAQLAPCAVLAVLAARCCSSSSSSSAQWPATPCTARAHRPALSPCLLPRTQRCTVSTLHNLVGEEAVGEEARESVLFIGTQISNLYTSVYTPNRGRVVVCLVFVIACKYALGHSQVSQALNRRLCSKVHGMGECAQSSSRVSLHT